VRALDLAVAVALAAVLVPAPAVAQAGADADTREVLAYRLTMPKLRQLDQAMAELHRQMEADPAYQALKKKKDELARLAAKEDLTDAEAERMAQLEEEIAAAEEEEEGGLDPENQSLSGMAAKMAGDPRIARALGSARLEAREAAVMMMAFFQAALAAELMESGGVTEVPEGVSAENVRFYRANKAEIATLKGLAREEQ
jgi:hypothetical protein